MEFTRDYILLHYPATRFEPSKVYTGDTGGGPNKFTFSIDLAPSGAKCILIKQFQFTSTARAAATTITFSLNGNTNIFRAEWLSTGNAALQNIQPLYYILPEQSSFTMAADDPNTNFIVYYQYWSLAKQHPHK